MSTLLKLGLSSYDVKPRFGAFQCEYLIQNPHFLGKNFGGTIGTYAKKKPTLNHSEGGGVHGKACWLIAYTVISIDVVLFYAICYNIFVDIATAQIPQLASIHMHTVRLVQTI